MGAGDKNIAASEQSQFDDIYWQERLIMEGTLPFKKDGAFILIPGLNDDSNCRDEICSDFKFKLNFQKDSLVHMNHIHFEFHKR